MLMARKMLIISVLPMEVRVAVSQVVLLSVLDDRLTAACPTVSLASHFDGGCPCESGMPVSLAGGGTNNAELIWLLCSQNRLCYFGWKRLDGFSAWLEYPYLQRILVL